MERSDFRALRGRICVARKAGILALSALALFTSTAFGREGGDPFNPGDPIRENRIIRKEERDLAAAQVPPVDERESGNWKTNTGEPVKPAPQCDPSTANSC